MFGYVAAALGECVLVRREDAGESFVDVDAGVPDYKLVLKDGRRLLVEVKNVRVRSFDEVCRMNPPYLDRLQRYASLVGHELLIAVYWHRLNMWSLTPPEAFRQKGKKRVLTLFDAMKRSRMSILGDETLGAVPPLRLRLENAIPTDVRDGGALFKAKGGQLFSAGHTIEKAHERMLAWLLMMYGSWDKFSEEAVIEDDRLFAIDFSVEPSEWEHRQGFAMIGSLSSVISSRFRHLTSEEDRVRMLSPSIEAAELRIDIASDYKGEALKLWRFVLLPNDDNVDDSSEAA